MISYQSNRTKGNTHAPPPQLGTGAGAAIIDVHVKYHLTATNMPSGPVTKQVWGVKIR